MGLEKAISSGQEHRRPHRGAKAVCFNCRNHGTCDYCRSNRLHSTRKREVAADAQQENMRCISAAERTPPQMLCKENLGAGKTQVMKTIEDMLQSQKMRDFSECYHIS